MREILAGPPPFAMPTGVRALDDFLAPAIALAQGGKRTRALFALAGWQAGGGFSASESAASLNPATAAAGAAPQDLPVLLGAAVELYQISALIHDDLIDQATTRRGVPTVHTAFASYHRAHGLLGEPERYGASMAILLGDYLLSLSASTLENYLAGSSMPIVTSAAAQRVRALFHAMTAEVAAGQYYDAHAEFVPLTATAADPQSTVTAAFTVLYHKSARYSVTVPTLLGALAAGADIATIHQLEAICTPLGEAFQLRDDALGIFGDPRVTGKPAGDDITEGKRTVLLGLTRQNAGPADRATIENLLGKPLTAADLATVQRIITRSGAYDEHERLIAQREERTAQLIKASALPLAVLEQLTAMLAGRAS